MPLTRKEKEARVEELNGKFQKAVAVTLVNFPGLTVSEVNELRKKLRDAEGEMTVAKNTLMRRAVKGTDGETLIEDLAGPNAAVFAYEDPVQVAKVLVEFAKEHEALKLRSGVLNGKVVDPDSIEALSKLPSREVLLGQLLSVLIATPTNLVQVLAAVLRKLLYGLKAIEEQKQ